MPLEAAVTVTHDHFPMAGKRDRFYGERGFLAHLADDRFVEPFPGFDCAARQCVEMLAGIARAPHHQHLAITDDRRADRKEMPIRVGAGIGHLTVRALVIRGLGAFGSATLASVSPLITAPARAISGLSEAGGALGQRDGGIR